MRARHEASRAAPRRAGRPRRAPGAGSRHRSASSYDRRAVRRRCCRSRRRGDVAVVAFDWPDVLREPADVVLPTFVDGGTSLVWIWFATGWTYAILLVPILLLPAALGRRRDAALGPATRPTAPQVRPAREPRVRPGRLPTGSGGYPGRRLWRRLASVVAHPAGWPWVPVQVGVRDVGPVKGLRDACRGVNGMYTRFKRRELVPRMLPRADHRDA